MSANSFGARGRLTVGETNCITPVIEIAHRRVGVERAIMTTVHAYAARQNLIDAPSREFGEDAPVPRTWYRPRPARHATRPGRTNSSTSSTVSPCKHPPRRIDRRRRVDLTLTRVVDSTLVKVMAWYDNEWGFTNR